MAYNQLSTYKTTWAETGESGVVTYTNTNIVSWTKGKIILRSGGWESVTTKRKMNQASIQFGLGVSVYQRKGVWYVDTPFKTGVLFKDGMTIKRT